MEVCTTRIQAPVILFFLSVVFLVSLLFKPELITNIKSIEELGMATLKDKRVQYVIGTNLKVYNILTVYFIALLP